MVTVKRINPDDDVTLEITASPEVWRLVVYAIGPRGDEDTLKELYDVLHAEVYRIRR